MEHKNSDDVDLERLRNQTYSFLLQPVVLSYLPASSLVDAASRRCMSLSMCDVGRWDASIPLSSANCQSRSASTST